MIDQGVPAPRLLAGYGDWYPKGIDSINENPMYNPLTLTWDEKIVVDEKTGKLAPTVLSLNSSKDKRL